MEFSTEQIKKVAKLAKISLTEEEVLLFNQQFVSIAQIITALQKVDTKNIAPVHNPSPGSNLMRQDIVTDGNHVEEIMYNAPKHAFNCFIVPKVVE